MLENSEFVFEDSYLPDDMFAATQASTLSFGKAESIQAAKDHLLKLTTDEFLLEAYNAATQLRNTLGDADALVADLSETIRSNILVVATACNHDPIGMILSSIRAMNIEEQSECISNIISSLHNYQQAIESEIQNGRY